VPSGNSSVTLQYTSDKGALRWQPILGKKIAINAQKCISTRDDLNAITYNGVFVVEQSKEDISDCSGLRDVAIATKFWPK